MGFNTIRVYVLFFQRRNITLPLKPRLSLPHPPNRIYPFSCIIYTCIHIALYTFWRHCGVAVNLPPDWTGPSAAAFDKWSRLHRSVVLSPVTPTTVVVVCARVVQTLAYRDIKKKKTRGEGESEQREKGYGFSGCVFLGDDIRRPRARIINSCRPVYATRFYTEPTYIVCTAPQFPRTEKTGGVG